MPVKPENLAKYPGGSLKSAEWQAVRRRIGERSGWKCEECKAPHRTMIARGTHGGRDAYMVLDTIEVFCAEDRAPHGQGAPDVGLRGVPRSEDRTHLRSPQP
jgi:hypothetical protein